MKKITKSLFVMMLFTLISIGFVACDKSSKITSIYVDIEETTIFIKHKSDWDPLNHLTVKAKLNDGSEKELKIDSCSFSGLDVNTVGEQTLIISYGAYDCSLDVEVYKYVTDIEIQEWPNSNVDHNGVLNTDDVKICVFYSDLTSDEDVTEGFTFGSAPTNEVGRHNVTITYTDAHGETASCVKEYKVNAVLESLSLDHNSYLSNFKWTSGADTYNYSTLKVTANYSDGSSLPVDVADLQFERKVTTNTVSSEDYFVVKYGNKTIQSNPINVYIDYEGLEVTGLPTSIEYGTKLDLKNVEANAVFTDGSKTELDVDDCIDYDFSNLGDTTITLSHEINGVTKTYLHNINVFEQFKGAIVAQPVDATTSKYFVVGDEFDSSRFKYFEVWSKNNKEITDMTAIAFDNAGVESSPKIKNVTIKYTKEGYDTPFTTTIQVEYVSSNDEIPTVEITSIEIESGLSDRIAHNQAIDVSELGLLVNYSNNESVVLDYNSDEMDYTFSSATVGEQTFTITYKGMSTTKTITVLRTLSEIELNQSSIRTLYNANNDIDLSALTLTLKYSTGDEVVSASAYADKSFSMDAARLVDNHSYTCELEFSFTPTDCYDNTPKSDTLQIEIYEEITNLMVTGLSDMVQYSSSDDYSDKNTNMKVYLVYTSNNKDEITLATETTSGYKVDKDIDLSKVGYQSFTISYYVYDETNGHQMIEGTTLSREVEVQDYVINYSVEGIQNVYKKSDIIDMDSCYLAPQYASGATASRLSYIKSGLTFNYNASETVLELGDYTLEVYYGGKTYTKTISIVEEYEIAIFEAPQSVTDYKSNSQRENTYEQTGTESSTVKGFTELGNIYQVGDDNAFKFEPIVKVKVGDAKYESLYEYSLTAQVFILDPETQNYSEALSGQELESYVDFNGEEHTFIFTSKATNNQFKILVGLEGYDSVTPIEFEFKVVDGFNVYTAAELSVFDNSNVTTAFSGTKIGTKWNEFKTNNGISNDIRTNAIILHNNINITKDDIPDCHFFKSNEVSASDIDYDRVVGSLKDSYGTDPNGRLHLQYIYYRTVASGEEFRFEGNYFQINIEDLPLIVRQANGTDSGKVSQSSDDAITTHTALFGFAGATQNATSIVAEVSDANYVPGNVYIENVDMYGNAKKTEDTVKSGGVIAYKSAYLNFNAYNNLTQACYIAYFTNGLDRTNSTLSEEDKFDTDGTLKTNMQVRLNKVNAYDSYNCLIYLWGTSKVYIDSSRFIGAGGPVMICDHVDDDEEHGGYTTNVYLDYNLNEGDKESVLESWVAGTEGWFAAYKGAGAAAQQLKALDQVVVNAGRTILDNKDEKINLVSVYKSGSAEGMTTAEIKGSFKVHKYNGLDFSDTNVSEIRKEYSEALCVIQSNNTLNEDGSSNFGLIVPGDEGLLYPTPDPTSAFMAFATSNKYMNVYLYNGMGAVVGLY